MNFKILLFCLSLLFMAACAKDPEAQEVSIAPPSLNGDADDSVIKGWIRIKLEESASPLRTGVFTRGEVSSGNNALDEVAASLGATEVRRSFSDGGKFAERRRKYGFHLWYDIRFDEEVPVSRAGADISLLPGIAHVQPLYRIEFADAGTGIPGEVVYEPALNSAFRTSEAPFNDPQLGKQWHYNNDGTLPRSVSGADMNAFEAWKVTAGDPSVIVAITDGGVDWGHPDLASNMWINQSEFNGTLGVDDDGNGYIDDIYGWNCMRNSGDIVPNSHGTHVAGTVGAVNNNGIGVAGVAGGTGKGDGVRLMSCQIFDDIPIGKTAEAYLYAAENGAVISQNSWVYSSMGILPEDISDAFDYFIETAGTDENGNQTGPMKGGVLIFAAGNDNQSSVKLPGADPRVIAVTAMAPDYTKAGYSNYGVDADIYAPGGAASADPSYPEVCRVYSTDTGGGYCYMSGTSMACPHVSGIAALIVSHYGVGNPGFTPEDLKRILLRSYRSVNQYIEPDYQDRLGVGLVDAGMIFLEDPQTAPAAITMPESSSVKNTVTLSWLVPVDGNDQPVANFQVAYTGKGIGKFEGRDEVSGKETLRNYFGTGARASYSLDLKYNTEYIFEVSGEDRYGNISPVVSFSHSTGDYENKKPKVAERFGTVEVENVGEEYAVKLYMLQYFTDPNLPDGDMLSYTVKNRNEDVVSVILEGETLIITPLAKGSANVTVYASDLDEEAVQSSMSVIVKDGHEAPPTPQTKGITLYPNPADAYLSVLLEGSAASNVSIRIYDSAQRLVLSSNPEFDSENLTRMDVSSLAPGMYTLAADNGIKRWTAAFLKK